MPVIKKKKNASLKNFYWSKFQVAAFRMRHFSTPPLVHLWVGILVGTSVSAPLGGLSLGFEEGG